MHDFRLETSFLCGYTFSLPCNKQDTAMYPRFRLRSLVPSRRKVTEVNPTVYLNHPSRLVFLLVLISKQHTVETEGLAPDDL